MHNQFARIYSESYWRPRYKSNTVIKKLNEGFVWPILKIPQDFLSSPEGQASLTWAIESIRKRGDQYFRHVSFTRENNKIIECVISDATKTAPIFLDGVPLLPKKIDVTTDLQYVTKEVFAIKKICVDCRENKAPKGCKVSL
jgi:hypothetical protein